MSVKPNLIAEPESAQPVRLYRIVACKLGEAIGRGDYDIGDRLPAERDLAISFSVSRPTIREAIIALELLGLVEVRVGSGVYVISQKASERRADDGDVSAFELTEARLLFEGEVAALAATLITEPELDELDALLTEMEAGNETGSGEVADRKFHQVIADATRNVAMAQVVSGLWDARERSPQSRSLLKKSRESGITPVIREHQAIVDALRARDPKAARAAMRDHLNRVLTYLLDATEVEAIAVARAKAAEQRQRYARGRTV